MLSRLFRFFKLTKEEERNLMRERRRKARRARRQKAKKQNLT
jgi:hypothetical protein